MSKFPAVVFAAAAVAVISIDPASGVAAAALAVAAAFRPIFWAAVVTAAAIAPIPVAAACAAWSAFSATALWREASIRKL